MVTGPEPMELAAVQQGDTRPDLWALLLAAEDQSAGLAQRIIDAARARPRNAPRRGPRDRYWLHRLARSAITAATSTTSAAATRAALGRAARERIMVALGWRS